MKLIPDKVVIHCSQCNLKLRFPYSRGRKLNIICPQCNTKSIFDSERYRTNYLRSISVLGVVIVSLIVTITILPFLMSPDLMSLERKFNELNKQVGQDFQDEIHKRKERYETIISSINISDLKATASTDYKTLMKERQNFNSKYALSPREKAQLKMLSLANNRTKSVDDIIREIAKEASPTGSSINIRRTYKRIYLDIDFQMSSLTSGEEGTRTKHQTIASLKKEALSLTSKVANDVYKFCKDLNLNRIYIGCKHIVRQEQQDGSMKDESQIIYKISIDKNVFQSLKNNPFLDIYSITKHFKVEVDNFSDLHIKRTRR